MSNKTKNQNSGKTINTDTSRLGLCLYFRVTESTLRGWIEKGMPKKARGVYSVPDCIAWRLEQKGLGKNESNRATYEEQLTKEKVIKLARENALQAGQVVSWDYHYHSMGGVGVLVSNIFESLGSRLADKLSGVDDPAIIQHEIWREGRVQLEEGIKKIARIDLSDYELEYPDPKLID